tara:strand:+ start:11 stop:547 length:537 start_codon:yes stop_codon:yes gene_type:complete
MNENGYNMTYGGGGTNGYVYTEEVKQRASERSKKQFENPEARRQMSERRKKYFEDNLEAGKEHSERLKKHFENPEARRQMSESCKKQFEDPEARQRASERTKKQYENPEARRKILDGKGKNKPFDIFTTEGTFIKTFNYQFEAREYLQKEHNITSLIKVGEVLNGNRKSSAGHVFKYK